MYSYNPFRSWTAEKPEPSTKKDFLKLSDLIEFFFIAHPKSGTREGEEHERVMFYYPENETIDKKTDITGFAIAIVHFTDDFTNKEDRLLSSSEYDHRYVTSKNCFEIVIQIEKGEFLMGIALNRQSCLKNGYFVHLPTVKAILAKTYETYRLFYGTFISLFNQNLETFKERIGTFFAHYLSILRVNQIPFLDLFSGVDFMQLSSLEFLSVQCLVNRCIEEFSCIEKIICLYQDQLMQYSVEKSDLIVLFRYLTQNLIPNALQNELQPGGAKKKSISESHIGKFITGSIDFFGKENGGAENEGPTFPIVYLTSNENANGLPTLDAYHLVAYRALNTTMCMFVKTVTPEFLQQLEDFLDPELCKLGSMIGDKVSNAPRNAQNDMSFYFIYFNPDSLSLKTNFSSPYSTSSSTNVPLPPKSIYKLACETLEHFFDEKEEFVQVQVKDESDWWVVVKKINERILILFIPNTAPSTIVDIHDTVTNIVKTYFANMFII
uniref:CCZ1/INTU/HSP4 first Longin domain-containing protein n=1 Tax=Acrobeloides nanus TaxID=290746 RepID=A0A914DZP8_9BILA